MKTPPSHEIAKRSSALRKAATEAETRLWKHLRNRQIEGCKFRRQTWMGPFVVDLVCFERKLVVEADGSQHVDDAEYDHHRSLFLEAEGFRVLRFWNNEVLTDIDGVLELIRTVLLTGLKPSPSHVGRGPLPLPKRERGA